jgi:Pyridoxal phosphate biosynthesis protein
MDKYLAVTMGEAGGVSPELILKALNVGSYGSFGGVVVVGDEGVFRRTASDLGLDMPFTAFVKNEKELRKAQEEGELYIFYSLKLIKPEHFAYGSYSAETGEATFLSTRKAIELIHNGYASALVTMPLDARALKAAGHKETNYEKMLYAFSSHDTSIRMLDTCGVKIFTHTPQIPVEKALKDITFEKILDTIIQVDAITHDRFAFDQVLPLGISTLNPHHEDSDSYGREEVEAVIPAIETARRLGIDIEGPIEAYHLVHGAKEGKYRAIITLCYEQAIVAATSYDFFKTILVIWGWPFLVVSVDRGPLMNIAGKGKANPDGALQALSLAYSYVQIGVNS